MVVEERRSMEDLLGGDLKAQRRKASGEAASPSPGPVTENNGTSSSVISETEYFLFHKVSLPKPTTTTQQVSLDKLFFYFFQFPSPKLTG